MFLVQDISKCLDALKWPGKYFMGIPKNVIFCEIFNFYQIAFPPQDDDCSFVVHPYEPCSVLVSLLMSGFNTFLSVASEHRWFALFEHFSCHETDKHSTASWRVNILQITSHWLVLQVVGG